MSWTRPFDVTSRWAGDGKPDDQTLLEQLIADAEEIIRFEYPDIADRIDDGESGIEPEDPLPIDRVRLVVSRMVTRHLRNPAGVRQVTETTGPFSENRTFAGDLPGQLLLTDEERRMLGYVPGAPKQRAFTVPFGGDPGGRLGGRDPWGLDVW